MDYRRFADRWISLSIYCGLGFAVLLHLLIVVHSAGRLRRLGK